MELNVFESSDSALGQRLSLALSHRPRRFKSRMAPALAYGRHRGPPRDDSRIAAVLIGLYQIDGHWAIPLTMRPPSLQHHGGQICLPGGRIEEGESPFEAALREYEEELGVSPTVQINCGELSQQYVFGSDNKVHPVVVTTERPSNKWRPDPNEVAEVILLPLSTLADARTRTTTWHSKQVRQDAKEIATLRFSAPAIRHGEYRIWGATAMILDELAQILQSLDGD